MGIEGGHEQAVGSGCTTTRKLGGGERTTTQEITRDRFPESLGGPRVDAAPADVSVNVDPVSGVGERVRAKNRGSEAPGAARKNRSGSTTRSNQRVASRPARSAFTAGRSTCALAGRPDPRQTPARKPALPLRQSRCGSLGIRAPGCYVRSNPGASPGRREDGRGSMIAAFTRDLGFPFARFESRVKLMSSTAVPRKWGRFRSMQTVPQSRASGSFFRVRRG